MNILVFVLAGLCGFIDSFLSARARSGGMHQRHMSVTLSGDAPLSVVGEG